MNSAERLEEKDFLAVTSTPEGRRFINRILGKCGWKQLSIGFPPSAQETAFREGRRSVGLWIEALYCDHPNKYIELLQENQKWKALQKQLSKKDMEKELSRKQLKR